MRSGLQLLKPCLEDGEQIFTLSDVFSLMIRHKRRIVLFALVGGVCALAATILSAPKHRIEAAFKGGGENTGSDLGFLKQFLGMSVPGASEPQVIVLMKSHPVLRPLIEGLGLQATVDQDGFFKKAVRRVRDNLSAEIGRPLRDVDSFLFRDLFYEGEQMITYNLQFTDPEHFSLFSGSTVVAQGVLGIPLRLPEVTFTLEKAPKKLRFLHPYSLCINSWIRTAQSLRSDIRIAVNKFGRSIYDLQFSHRDRHLGTKLLNELMKSYCNYLKTDYDRISSEQLSYLECRQREIYEKLFGLFEEHSAYLQSNLSKKGFIGINQEANGLSISYQRMLEKLFDVEMELGRIALMEKEQKPIIPSGSGSFFTSIQPIIQKIQNLKQQRDLVELSLQGKDLSNTEQHFISRQEELQEIRQRGRAVQRLLDVVESKEEASSSHPMFEPIPSLSHWALGLSESSNEEKADLVTYLEGYLRLLSMQEKMVEERIFYSEAPSNEFVGLDLQTSRSLLLKYHTQIDENETQMRHLKQLRREITADDFELSSLSAVLTDPLSMQLLKRTNAISLQLKDEKYHSEKEGARWKEELLLDKKILADHLEQLLKLEQLQLVLAREKTTGLQQAILGCINSQLSVLHERMGESIKERCRTLGLEGEILKQTMTAMRENFADFPERWRKEKWLDLRTQMGVKMIQSLTELVESKTIGTHLHHVESKPLDLAALPSVPESPRLLLKSFLGMLGGGSSIFFFALVQSIFRGFPTSSQKLRAMRYPFLGEIGARWGSAATTEPDLEPLRKIALFIHQLPKRKVISLITARGPDYSWALGEILGKMSRRVLILRCDFQEQGQVQNAPGLYQVWNEGKTPLPIRRENFFDYLPSGGFSLHGAEFIQSETCRQILTGCSADYDHIFLLLRSPLDAIEHQAALCLSDGAIVTVSGEATELLTPFIEWAYDGDVCRLAFVALDQR